MINRSCEQMPTLKAVESALNKAKISIEVSAPYFITPDLQDLFLYSGKQRPEMYLSNSVRKGISSFHNYCLESELESGLNKLREDIETGAINEIMENYKMRMAITYSYLAVYTNDRMRSDAAEPRR